MVKQCHQCIHSNTNSDAESIHAYRKLCRSVNVTLEPGNALPGLSPSLPGCSPTCFPTYRRSIFGHLKLHKHDHISSPAVPLTYPLPPDPRCPNAAFHNPNVLKKLLTHLHLPLSFAPPNPYKHTSLVFPLVIYISPP